MPVEESCLCSLSCALVFSMFSAGFANAQGKTIAERLGYPADTKQLIIHADDLAVAHSVNQANFDAFERKAITLGSIMVPCPWFTEVAAYAKGHPEVDLGLHLTLNSEWKTYRWGPISPVDKVPGLLDPQGYLWANVPPVAQHAKAEEVEREIRGQVERALAAGIQPTHLDTHMGTVLFNPAFAAAYIKVAREYHLPFLALRQAVIPVPRMAEIVAMLEDTEFVLDALVSVRPGARPEEWKAAYAQMIGDLKPGLTQLIVHLGYDDAELRAITVDHPDFGSAWRQRDFDAVTSLEFAKLLKENNVILVGWKDLKKLVQ